MLPASLDKVALLNAAAAVGTGGRALLLDGVGAPRRGLERGVQRFASGGDAVFEQSAALGSYQSTSEQLLLHERVVP